MTADEIDRLTKALKDEKFGEMLRDYARELSDPENKKRYEEEIRLLEQERGNAVEFIHPEPFRALRTSVNGERKCFINICASEKVGKPECKWGVSEEGRRGECWSLPHSLHPGRQDTDTKGNKIMIYDVVFHPDTLHIASKNSRFMDMVDSTAMQGIQNAFKVTLDQNNVREMSTKYKGTPQPCVTRKPIPGYKTKGPSEEPDPLAFPYPDEKRPTTSPQIRPTESPATKHGSDAEPKSFSGRPQEANEPTEPNYTVKYRSFIDLQDFRCSRDSAQSPRPREIVVAIDVPLLKAASEASVEVKERQLLLESKKPAYRLELPLAYPVDEDKGEAKFNKQRGQLTVTLPVLPSNEAFDFAVGSAQSSVGDDEGQQEKSEAEEEDEWKEVAEDSRQQTRVGKVEEGGRGQEKGEEQTREGGNSEEVKDIGVEEEAKWEKRERKGREGAEEEKLKEQRQENEKEVRDFNLQKGQRHEEKRDSGCQCDAVDVPAEEENSSPVDNGLVASPETENQPVLITVGHLTRTGKEGEAHLDSCLESTPKKKTRESVHGNEKVETDAAFLRHSSSEESQTSIAANTQESSETPATDNANKSNRGEPALGSVKREEGESVGEDDLQTTEQILRSPEPLPVLLREIDKDGNEKIISNHSTSAGFTFQNSLMYELD